MNKMIERDESDHQDRNCNRECLPDDDYWRQLWGNVLNAALVAVIGVLVREVVVTIEGRTSDRLDPY